VVGGLPPVLRAYYPLRSRLDAGLLERRECSGRRGCGMSSSDRFFTSPLAWGLSRHMLPCTELSWRYTGQSRFCTTGQDLVRGTPLFSKLAVPRQSLWSRLDAGPFAWCLSCNVAAGRDLVHRRRSSPCDSSVLQIRQYRMTSVWSPRDVSGDLKRSAFLERDRFVAT
jgi:hypothetical protein